MPPDNPSLPPETQGQPEVLGYVVFSCSTCSVSYFFPPFTDLCHSALRPLPTKIQRTMEVTQVSELAHLCDDRNFSPIRPSAPNVQAWTSCTANSSQPATIPTPLENVRVQQTRAKRKPGSGRPKGSKSTVAPDDRPRRLGRPPGTGHLQRARLLSNTSQPEKRPAVVSERRPFNLVCF